MITREKIEKRIKNFRTVMKRDHLPITPQKLAIFQFLASTESHPSAQHVFERMKYYFTNISLSTIYKNLNKFKELKLLREIEMKDTLARYDAGMEPHHHIINLDTDEILDVDPSEIGNLTIPEKTRQFDLDSISINFFVRNKPKLSRFEELKVARTKKCHY